MKFLSKQQKNMEHLKLNTKCLFKFDENQLTEKAIEKKRKKEAEKTSEKNRPNKK